MINPINTIEKTLHQFEQVATGKATLSEKELVDLCRRLYNYVDDTRRRVSRLEKAFDQITAFIEEGRI